MTSSNPISPPALSASSTTSPPASDIPISPVSRSGTFPHKTSPAVATTRPFIETDMKAINEVPVEIDGVPTSPDELQRRGTEGSGKLISPGLGEEDEIEAEFLGEGREGLGKEVQEKRAAMLASRSKDPGVIVDVPQEPTAEEVEAAKSAEGTVTPGLPSSEGEKRL